MENLGWSSESLGFFHGFPKGKNTPKSLNLINRHSYSHSTCQPVDNLVQIISNGGFLWGKSHRYGRNLFAITCVKEFHMENRKYL